MGGNKHAKDIKYAVKQCEFLWSFLAAHFLFMGISLPFGNLQLLLYRYSLPHQQYHNLIHTVETVFYSLQSMPTH